MAGGVGSRFWPMSTVDKPKQFIDVLGTGRTLLQLTFDRFEGVCDPENVWVVTNKSMQPWFTSSCLKSLRVIFCRNHAEETQLLASPISVGESRKGSLCKYCCITFWSYRYQCQRIQKSGNICLEVYWWDWQHCYFGNEAYSPRDRLWLYSGRSPYPFSP